MKLPELKKWFAEREVPKEMQMNAWTKINDVRRCVDVLILHLEAQKNNKGYLPYYKLLIEIKNKIENGN